MTKQLIVTIKYLTMTTISLLLSFSLVACNVHEPNERISINESSKPISVEELLSKANNSEGSKVEVAGVFMGWKGNCAGGPPMTRSDWMLESDGICVYVTGPVPQGIQKGPQSKDIGKKTSVQGIIKLDRLGVPFLKAI